MKLCFSTLAGFTVAALAALAAAPEGWLLAGSKPANYDTGIDSSAVFQGHTSSFLKAKADQEGFGTLMQMFSAKDYAGKRIRLSGYVKSDSVTRWAGMWMRVDGESSSGGNPKVLAFDNMQRRPITGTSDWQSYEVVLEVPATTQAIALGILLDGPGEVWLNSTRLDVVSTAVETTGSGANSLPEGPKNLSFENQ